MKKIFLILMLMGNLTSGLAQQKMTFQKACHPPFYFRRGNARHEGTEVGNRPSAPC